MKLIELLCASDVLARPLNSTISIVDHIDRVRWSERCVNDKELCITDKTDNEIIFAFTLYEVFLNIETTTDLTTWYVNETE
jgi:hypothetical protein